MLSSPATYRQFRVVVSGNVGNQRYTCFSDLELWGTKAGDPSVVPGTGADCDVPFAYPSCRAAYADGCRADPTSAADQNQCLSGSCSNMWKDNGPSDGANWKRFQLESDGYRYVRHTPCPPHPHTPAFLKRFAVGGPCPPHPTPTFLKLSAKGGPVRLRPLC